MEADTVAAGGAGSAQSKLSMSSPGRLLLRPPEFREDDDSGPPSPPSYRQHARRESYTPSTSQALPFTSSMDVISAGLVEENERTLFAPPVSSQSTVRRIIRNDSFSDVLAPKPILNSSSEIDIPQFSKANSSGRLTPSPPTVRREAPICFSTTAVPSLDIPLDRPVAKRLSCFSRIFPNLGLVFILATIWLVILVYGEYAYPHSHSQFCNSYLPKESLMGRIVVISNPNIAQLELKSGFFDLFYNVRAKIDSFLSDFNMRRNYRILQEKCAPDAFLFTGSLIASTSSDSTSDNPDGTLDEEAYLRLINRWDWIFTKTENSKFLFSPSISDIAFRAAFSRSTEIERRLLYQRFIDFFGHLNWEFDFGPYTLASVFTPILPLSVSTVVVDEDGKEVADLETRSSINTQIATETETFLSLLEEKAKKSSSADSRFVLVSPVTLYPDTNATCLDSDIELAPRVLEQLRYTSLNSAATSHLLQRLRPKAVLSRGVASGCTMIHKDTDTLQTIMISSSDRSKMFSSRQPAVLVLEARNATAIQSAGASSLLTTITRPTEPSLSTDRSPFELITIFFEATTYMDMKGPYIWLVVFSVLGCMIMVETSSSPPPSSNWTNSSHQTDFYSTSSLIEVTIACVRFLAFSSVLLVRKIAFTCAKTPLKVCLPPLDLEAGHPGSPYHRSHSPTSRFWRICRVLALRIQITTELMLVASVIVVPWCIFVMFHWM